MKRKICILSLLIISIYSSSIHAQVAAPAWKLAGRQTFGKVYFDLYAKTGSWGMGQQFYGANFYNGTFNKAHVKAELVANLVCGNEAVSHVDFTVDRYGSMNRIDPDAKGQAEGWMSDNTGLVWAADEKNCLGNEILVDGYFGQKTRNRIASLEIRKLKLYSVEDDGTEIEMTVNGDLINPPASAKKAAEQRVAQATQQQQTTSQQATAQQATAANNNTQQHNNTTYNQQQAQQLAQQQQNQAQTQQYINNAQNPDNESIQSAAALNQAKINAMKPGGSTYEQRQEIQQAQQQQDQASNAAVSSSLSNLGDAFANLAADKERKRAYKEQQAQENARLEAQMKQQEEAERVEDENRLQKQRADSINMVNSILGSHSNEIFRNPPSGNASIDRVYYVPYYIFYQGDDRYLHLFPVVSLYSYYDGTWPSLIELKDILERRLCCHEEPAFMGYYTDVTTANKVYRDLITNSALGDVIVLKEPYDNKTEDTLSFQWYKKAANAGDVNAFIYVALYYEDGIGVRKDTSNALIWLNKCLGSNATSSDKAKANNILGNCYLQGTGVEKNDSTAAMYYQKATDAGNRFAMYNLATLYEKGTGVEKNSDEALKWYRNAYSAGYSYALYKIKILQHHPGPGFVKLPSGLEYKMVKPGTGPTPKEGQSVSIKFTAKTLDGKVINSNVDPAFHDLNPMVFTVGSQDRGAIHGLDEGVRLMKKGGKMTFYIPSPLAFGEGSTDRLPANSDLIFDVEVLSVK